MKVKLEYWGEWFRKAAPFVLVLAMLFQVYTFFKLVDHGHDWGGDFALYLSQAEAIGDGSSFDLAEQNRECMLGSYKRIGPDLYPPGYPLMLYPLVELFGRNFVVFKAMNLVYFLASMLLLSLLLGQFIKRSQAQYFTAFLSVHPFFLGFNQEIISDVPVLFFALLAWYLFDKWHRSDNKLHFLLIGLVVGFGVLIKSLALTLAAAIIVALIQSYWSKREKYRLFQLLFFGLGVFSMLVVSKLAYPGSSSSYMEQLKELSAGRMYNNLVYNLQLPKEFLFNSDGLYYLFSFLFLSGLITELKNKKATLFYWFFLFHLLLLVIWPFHEGPRFMFVLFPVLGFFFLKGCSFWSAKGDWAKRSVWAYGLLVLLHLPFHVFPVSFGAEKTSYVNQAASEDALKLYEYIEKHTTSEDELIFFKPRVIRYYTGRQAYIIEDRGRADTSGAQWYVRYEPWGGFDVNGYEKVFNNSTFSVFKMRP